MRADRGGDATWRAELGYEAATLVVAYHSSSNTKKRPSAYFAENLRVIAAAFGGNEPSRSRRRLLAFPFVTLGHRRREQYAGIAQRRAPCAAAI